MGHRSPLPPPFFLVGSRPLTVPLPSLTTMTLFFFDRYTRNKTLVVFPCRTLFLTRKGVLLFFPAAILVFFRKRRLVRPLPLRVSFLRILKSLPSFLSGVFFFLEGRATEKFSKSRGQFLDQCFFSQLSMTLAFYRWFGKAPTLHGRCLSVPSVVEPCCSNPRHWSDFGFGLRKLSSLSPSLWSGRPVPP